MKTFYGLKAKQTHAYNTDGKRLLITRLTVQPGVITQVKTVEKDGYHGVQIALGRKKAITKPLTGHLKNIENQQPRWFREIKMPDNTTQQIGQQVKASDIFHLGDKISVYAISKGRGFAGVMKRWNFSGGPRTHGQSDRERAPGSIGQGTTPGRVWKGKKMAGHLGNSNHCVRGGQVVFIDEEKAELWVTGTVPGPIGGLVRIENHGEGKFSGLYQAQVANPIEEIKEDHNNESQEK